MTSFTEPKTIKIDQQMPVNGNNDDSENPTLGTEIDDIESVVEENTGSNNYYENDENKGVFQHKVCCFWIIAFVLIMIFSRQVVHAFF
mmetsp:Transcript_22040/g.54457  ORF Transcript_22040/g.54457 Transcript_22040/m.54457 type:complete len:88 (-) Transcript_22040:281-544(-)